jgi:transposase-like protein
MNLEESFKLIDEGKESIRSLAKKLGIPKSTLHRWYKKWKEGKSIKRTDEIEKKIEETVFNVAKKPLEEFIEKTLKPMLDSKLKLIEDELTSVKKRVEQAEVEEGEIEIEGTKIRRVVELSPITLQYYDYYITETGDKIDLGEFIDEIVDEHFSKCLGIEVAVIIRPESKLSKK